MTPNPKSETVLLPVDRSDAIQALADNMAHVGPYVDAPQLIDNLKNKGFVLCRPAIAAPEVTVSGEVADSMALESAMSAVIDAFIKRDTAQQAFGDDGLPNEYRDYLAACKVLEDAFDNLDKVRALKPIRTPPAASVSPASVREDELDKRIEANDAMHDKEIHRCFEEFMRMPPRTPASFERDGDGD
jgi:hypothetical protein